MDFCIMEKTFDYLKKSPHHGAAQEIYLTDALLMQSAADGLCGCTADARRFDIGNKLEFLKATVEFGLQSKEYGTTFRNFLNDLLQK